METTEGNKMSDRAFVTKFMIWLESCPYYLSGGGKKEWRKYLGYDDGSIVVNYKEVVDAFLNGTTN